MNSCYRTSNNKYQSAPPRMSDGRHFTDYRANCHMNQRIQTDKKIPNSYEYRMYLQRNAEELMELNKQQTYLLNGSFECKEPYHIGTMLPESHKQVCNAQSCTVKHNYENGLGLGRDYGESDLLTPMKAPYMKLEKNNCMPESHMDKHNVPKL